jgi:hypothetical protein
MKTGFWKQKGIIASSEKAKRMTVADWDDVADLCEQFCAQAETCYEAHTIQARNKAARWMSVLSMKAHDNARRLEEKQKRKDV